MRWHGFVGWSLPDFATLNSAERGRPEFRYNLSLGKKLDPRVKEHVGANFSSLSRRSGARPLVRGLMRYNGANVTSRPLPKSNSR
jgi:hypothetical protein